MRKTRVKTLYFIVSSVGIVFLLAFFVAAKKGLERSDSEQDRITEDAEHVDLGNGFSGKMLEGWNLQQTQNSVNTVKYGSPTYYSYFVPAALSDSFEPSVPTISIHTFTIDKRLRVRDVVNLSHDQQQIANKLEQGTEACIFDVKNFKIRRVDAYSYISDTADFSRCKVPDIEPGIVRLVFLKNVGDPRAMMITYGAGFREDFDRYLPAFESFLQSVTLKK